MTMEQLKQDEVDDGIKQILMDRSDGWLQSDLDLEEAAKMLGRRRLSDNELHGKRKKSMHRLSQKITNILEEKICPCS